MGNSEPLQIATWKVPYSVTVFTCTTKTTPCLAVQLWESFYQACLIIEASRVGYCTRWRYFNIHSRPHCLRSHLQLDYCSSLYLVESETILLTRSDQLRTSHFQFMPEMLILCLILPWWVKLTTEHQSCDLHFQSLVYSIPCSSHFLCMVLDSCWL